MSLRAACKNLLIAREWRGRPYLISPVADFLMVGGLGLILMGLMIAFLPPEVRNEPSAMQYSAVLGALVTYHVFAINYPHFASSYQIAYRRLPAMRASSGLPRVVRLRYAFALVVFPALYLGYCLYALLVQPENGLWLLGLLINLMFITVGWHYCKQCFGIGMVLSALKGIYFTRFERRVLLAHALLIWLITLVTSNMVAYQSQFWGLPYHSMGLGVRVDPIVMKALLELGKELLQVLGVSSLLVIIAAAWRVRKFPSLAATTGYFMLYPLVFITGAFHPLWLWILPAVHSLQYLLFVAAYRRGEVQGDMPDFATPRLRWHAFAAFFAVALVLGAIQFSWLPHLLDALVAPEHKYHLPLLFMALVTLFVNIHHYFIDNVIWRKENPQVGRYLMGR